MRRRFDAELAAGIFLIAGIAALAYLSIRMGRMEVIGRSKSYTLYADFRNVGGMKTGAPVLIAGVEVGRVSKIALVTPEDYMARAELVLNEGVRVQSDAAAAIKTRGLIGEKYIEISPGGADVLLQNGETIIETNSPIDIEALISKFVFGGLSPTKPAAETQPSRQ